MKTEFLTDFEVDPDGMTVPYPPLFDDVRRNHGFIDVRGKPELAASIPECLKSPALRELLVALAQPHSRWATLGCDLGVGQDSDTDGTRLHLAGGYVQIVSSRYSSRRPDEYHRLARALEASMSEIGRRHRWRLRFVMMPARINLDSNSTVEPSLWIWFDAVALKSNLAIKSRDNLLNELRVALDSDDVLTI